MHKAYLRYGWVMILGLALSLASSSVAAASAAAPAAEKTQLELSISPDGRSIVDQSGKEVARFKDDMRVRPAKTGVTKMQGCMCCEPSCLIYDKDGNCIKTVNSCTWDFDCSCKK